jgi:hypothetical protein
LRNETQLLNIKQIIKLTILADNIQVNTNQNPSPNAIGILNTKPQRVESQKFKINLALSYSM